MSILFTLKKLIAPFLLPPGLFVILLIAVGMIFFLRRQWRIGLVNVILGLALWTLSIAPVANTLMRGLEASLTIPDRPAGDVIILLGGGTIQRVPDLSGMAAPSPLAMGRVVAAARLYRRLGLPILVSGGRSSDAEVSEAAVAKRFLIDLGVPEQFLIEEDQARDTRENARFSAAICRRRGFVQPILLTAAHHLKRARMAFEAEGLPVTPFPAYFMGSVDSATTWRDFLPRAINLHAVSNALHEYLGICYFWMVGR